MIGAGPPTTSRTSSRRLVVDGVLTVALGLLAWSFRVLSSADLTNDHYMQLGWAQQLLFSELPGRDFVDAGMPLTYTLSAAFQYVRPGPFTEMMFAGAMLGVAASATYLATARLTQSAMVGTLVTLLAIALPPRLYNFAKLLVPAVTLLLLEWYMSRPSTKRIVWLGVWTTVAGLLRHDLALYAAGGMIAGIVAFHAEDARRLASASLQYVAGAVAALLPYLLYVQWAEGVGEHLRRGVEFARNEAHQRFFTLPPVPSLSAGMQFSWNRDESAAFLFYLFHALAVAAIANAAIGWRRHSPARRAAGLAAAVMLVGYLAVILRYPIEARLADMDTACALVAGLLLADLWTVVVAQWRGRRIAAIALAVTGALLLAVSARSIWTFADLTELIDNTGFNGGWRAVKETYVDLDQRGTEWPWRRSWPTGDLPAAVPYLDECTQPTDALVVTWFAPEYNFFARRRFGAGNVSFFPPDSFTTQKDQQHMISSLRQHEVPVILINETRRAEFASAFPLVDRYLSDTYLDRGEFTIYDGSVIAIAVRKDLRATGAWGPNAWPCHFVPAGS